MKLFHGTSKQNLKTFKIIKRKNNTPEFGDGLYFTTNLEQAKEWSCYKSKTGAVYEIDIDLKKLKGKNLENDDLFYYLSYLNRIDLKELVDECLDELNGLDYIFGKMIKNVDEFKENAEKFNEGDIELKDFKKLTKWFGKGYNQYCFKSKEAIDLVNKSIKKIHYISRSYKTTKIIDFKDLNSKNKKI